MVQERDAGEGRLLPHGAAVQPGADAAPPPLWWGTLNISGYKRASGSARSACRATGAGCRAAPPDLAADDDADLRADRPDAGRVVVKLIYDHRVLDGAYVARRLRDIEETLNGVILEELRGDRPATESEQATGPPPLVEPLLKPHLRARAGAMAPNREL